VSNWPSGGLVLPGRLSKNRKLPTIVPEFPHALAATEMAAASAFCFHVAGDGRMSQQAEWQGPRPVGSEREK